MTSETAELTLRFGATRLQGRLRWPVPGAEQECSALILLLADADSAAGAEALGAALCTSDSAAVLSFITSPGRSDGSLDTLECAALGWVAEHAAELAAGAAGLMVAGLGAAGARAAWLAVRARGDGWPELSRQLLVHPAFTAAYPMAPDVSGVAPATIVTTGSPYSDGARYARLLRAAGVEVEVVGSLLGRAPGKAGTPQRDR